MNELQDLRTLSEEEFKQLISKQSLLEKYTGNQILRAMVQMIPAVGPVVDAFVATPGTKQKEERLNLLLLLFYKSIAQLDERTTRLEWGETEAFHDMLNAAISSSMKTRSREKIIMNAMILANIMVVENDGRFRPEEYLYALEDLSPVEVNILLVFYRAYARDSADDIAENELGKAKRINVKETLVSELGLDKEDLIFILSRLSKTGLVKEITGMFLNYTGGEFAPTETMFRLMDYINKQPLSKLLV